MSTANTAKTQDFDSAFAELTADFLNQKIILVTGAGGSIGRALCRKIMKYNPQKLIMADICENNLYMLYRELCDNADSISDALDIPKNNTEIIPEILSVCNADMLKKLFRKHRPNIVYHAAAHKHVSLMENNPCEAVANNIFGTHNLLTAADKYDTKTVVIISTDKAVNPVGVMGATKKACEMLAAAFSDNPHTKTAVSAVRFGNVTASDGSVIPIFKNQIEKGGPITITDSKCTRYFMSADNAVKLLLAAGAKTKGGEIFSLDMGKPKKIYEIAKKMILDKGLVLGKDIEIIQMGLRPGERLYEENTFDPKTAVPTSLKDIYIAKPLSFDKDLFNKKLNLLKKYSDASDDIKTRKALFDLVSITRCDETDIKNHKIKKYNIPIFIPHEGCPHTCVFCNQKKITGVSTHVTCDDVRSIIKQHLDYLPKKSENNKNNIIIETAFFGGSFTGLPLEEQEEFLKTAAEFSSKTDGIRMSTRPDYINHDVLSLAKKYGVKTIELGIQSANDKVLALNNRGHCFKDVCTAAKLIKSYDIDFGAQVMVGMYGSDPKKDIETARAVAKLNPKCVRIYPTLTLKGTKLEELYKTDLYTPYDMDTAIDVTDKIMEIFEDINCDIIRVGLHSDESLTTDSIAAGPYHPAFKELVLSRRQRKIIENDIINQNIKDCVYTVHVSKNIISHTAGHNKCNINYFKDKYNIDLKIKTL